MLLALSVPIGNERSPLYMDQALAAIHQGNLRRLPFCLEVGQRGGTVTLICRFPAELQAVVEGQLYAQYPECRIEHLPGDALNPPAGTVTWRAALQLHPDVFPMKRYTQFEDVDRTLADPLSALLTAIASRKADRLCAHITLTVRPARARVQSRARACLLRLSSPLFRRHHRLAHAYVSLAMSHRWTLRLLGWLLGRLGGHGPGHAGGDPLTTSTSRGHDREEDLQAAADKLARLLFEAHLHVTVTGPKDAGRAAYAKLAEVTGGFGAFAGRRATFRRRARRHRGAGFLLSAEELATLWHPPTVSVRAPTLATVASRELPPPATLPRASAHPQLAILGTTSFRGQRQRFGILPDDRLRHLAILGKTGMGKSTLLHQLIAADIAAGRGVGLIDPHGDLTEDVLTSIPRHRTNDVILFDVGDTAFPLAFNVLACDRPAQRPLIASGVLSAFKKLYADSWGPRLEHILRTALLTLLEVPGTTLVSLLRLLSDARYRQHLVTGLTDPIVRSFWEHEFAGMHPKLQAEAIAPIQNKVGHFVSSPILRNLVGQAESRLNLRSVLDGGKVLLVNLSKGRIGDDASSLLGALLVTSLQLAAMSRADVPEAERSPFHLYVDEFQNFATDSFSTILSEARKYRLALTVANQYLAQIPEATLAALFGNVGTLTCFQVGAQDAELLATQLGGDLLPEDLLQLPRYAAYVRLLIEGTPSRPFSMRTLPPATARSDPRRADIIRRTSRQRYARPLVKVEQEIQAAFAHA